MKHPLPSLQRPVSSTSDPAHSPSTKRPPGSSKLSPPFLKTRPQLQSVAPSPPLRRRPRQPAKPCDEPPPPPAHHGIIKQLDTRLIPITQVHKELGAIYGMVCALEAEFKEVITRPQDAYSAHQERKGPKPHGHRRKVIRPKAPRSGIQVLKGTLQGKAVCAIPDSGAQANMISKRFTEELKLPLIEHEPDEIRTFVLPNGKSVETVGKVGATWEFLDEARTACEQVFYVLAESIFDVLIGSPFLRVSKTMSTYRHRLTRIPRPPALSARYVNLIGMPSQRIEGTLDGNRVAALPDSGSEPNLISHEYARSHGWLYDTSPKCKHPIMFADGSQDRTAGQVTLPWSFDIDGTGGGSEIEITFSILHGCPFDVILGNDFLDETEAFTAHMSSLKDILQTSPSLCHVIWLSKSRSKTSSRSPPATATAIEEEMERRAEADRPLRNLSGDEVKHTATMQERLKRDAWERAQGTPPSTESGARGVSAEIADSDLSSTSARRRPPSLRSGTVDGAARAPDTALAKYISKPPSA